jgi:hypothetical protein
MHAVEHAEKKRPGGSAGRPAVGGRRYATLGPEPCGRFNVFRDGVCGDEQIFSVPKHPEEFLLAMHAVHGLHATARPQ